MSSRSDRAGPRVVLGRTGSDGVGESEAIVYI